MEPDEVKRKSKTPLPSETAFIAPFVLLLLAPAVTAWLSASTQTTGGATDDAVVESPQWLPLVTTAIQVVLCGGVLWAYRKTYIASFPIRISGLAIAVGLAGVVLWVLLCAPRWETRAAEVLGLGALIPSRPSVNPFETYQGPSLVAFLVLRFAVLAVIVPIVEELLVRGWLVRWVAAAENWDVQELKTVGWKPMLAVLVYAVATHPAEAIAAIAWFSLVNWLMKRTGNFWDCVVAHAVTNLTLGFWILYSGDWRLW